MVFIFAESISCSLLRPIRWTSNECAFYFNPPCKQHTNLWVSCAFLGVLSLGVRFTFVRRIFSKCFQWCHDNQTLKCSTLIVTAYDCKLANKDPNHKELVIVRPLVVLNPTTINNGPVRFRNM